MKKIKEGIKTKTYTKYQKLFDELYTWKDITKKTLLMLLIIVIVDYLNISTKLIELKELIVVYVIVILLGIIKILEFKPWNLYKLKTVNYVDSFLFSLIITLFLYASIIFIVNKNVDIKVIISSILVFILYILEINRILKINKTKDKKQQTNVYDLKDLYEGKIKNENNLILIREKEVEYDLLERGHIINKLYELVFNCCNEEKFVVALEGKWGSGKTTIINNLKKLIKNEENIIVIDNFDPWSYEDEKAMFRGMFDSIMEKIGINFSIRDINDFIKTYMNTIFNIENMKRPIIL